MPSAQVIDFGSDPFADSIGKFAQGFSNAYYEKQNQEKNEKIFDRIKKKYGPNAKPDQMLRDIIEAEGFDESYKRDLIKDIKDYAALSTKKELTPYQEEMLNIRKEELDLKKRKGEQDDGMTPYQKRNLELQEVRLENDRKRIENAARNQDEKFPKLVADYTNSVLKDSDNKLPPSDKAILNQRIQSNITDDGMTMDEAFNEALDYIDMKNQIVDSAQLEERPTRFFGEATQQELEQAMGKAYEGLKQLYEAGIESQRDLRAIARRAGWQPEEITAMLQRIMQRKGKRVRS